MVQVIFQVKKKKEPSVTYMGHCTRYVMGSVKVIIELLYLTFSKGGYPS